LYLFDEKRDERKDRIVNSRKKQGERRKKENKKLIF